MSGITLKTMGLNELAKLKEEGCESDQIAILEELFNEVSDMCKAPGTIEEKNDLISRLNDAIDALEKDCPDNAARIESLRNIVLGIAQTKCGGP